MIRVPLYPRFIQVCAALILLSCAQNPTHAGCTNFAGGVHMGNVWIGAVQEASGIAASRKNPGILWTHNDGSDGILYSVSSYGAHLATFYLNRKVDDTEDVAVGPGPVAGVSYLYVGDIGSKNGRRSIQILRTPEPFVDPNWSGNPRSMGFADVQTFTLNYPDGAYDAETLMVDPITRDLFIVTKENWGARLYRANLTNVTSGSTAGLQFVRNLPFASVSGGDISDDGSLIVLRREDYAKAWGRSPSDTISTALASRPGRSIPIVGPPLEKNGEGIALLPHAKGYVTIGEGRNPAIYHFQPQCPEPPRFTTLLQDRTGTLGKSLTLRANATGYPQPSYRWFINGRQLPGQTRNTLIFSRLRPAQEGEVTVIATNPHGRVESTAYLTLRYP